MLLETQTRMVSDMKFVGDALILTLLWLGGVIALNTDIVYIATIAGASLAGSIVLAYFRRDRDHKEIFFKSACASMCGLVAGAVITRRWEVVAVEYTIAVYFFTSLLSLFFIKGLLAFTEQNASGLVISILQKIVNSKTGGSLSLNQHDTEPPATVVKTDIIVKKDGEVIEKEISPPRHGDAE